MNSKNQSLSTNIENKLRKMIFVDKIYGPNDQLPNEIVLAEKMGVSRTTIREAIKSLVASGVVEIIRGVGTFVSTNPGMLPDPFGLKLESDKIKVLMDWYRVRLTLESDAMELVVENASDEEIEEINKIVKLQNNLADKNTIEYIRADQKFHTLLALATHNKIMERIIPSLYQSIYYDSVYYDLIQSTNKSLSHKLKENVFESHEKIVKFLQIRDARGANLAMRYHIQSGINDMNRHFLDNKEKKKC